MLDVVVPVVAGSFIGYVTNWLAIKMLFWPHEPHFVFGLRLPFTPGLFVRRRRDFSASISELVEERFVNSEQLYQAMKKAEDDNLVQEFVQEMGVVFTMAFNAYANRVTENEFRRDCQKVADRLRQGQIVSTTLCRAMDQMSTTEIESMIMSVVHRELRGITWFGALLGGLIGMSQLWVR